MGGANEVLGDRAKRRNWMMIYGSWGVVACSRVGLVFIGVPFWLAFFDVGSPTLVSVGSLAWLRFGCCFGWSSAIGYCKEFIMAMICRMFSSIFDIRVLFEGTSVSVVEFRSPMS
jgi:hypothetical protein